MTNDRLKTQIRHVVETAKAERSAIEQSTIVQAIVGQLEPLLAKAIETAVLSYSREIVLQLHQLRADELAECNLAALSVIKSRLDEIGLKVAEFAVVCKEDQARFFLTFASDL